MVTAATERLLAKLLLVAFAMLAPATAMATAQEPDLIRIDGTVYPLTTNPLEPYLKAHPDALPTGAMYSTARWRGYVAVFELRKQHLFLTAVRIGHEAKSRRGWSWIDENVFGTMFPGEKRIPADWYSGTLIVPSGKLAQYVHMGYASVYDHYLILTARQGHVVEQHRFSRDEFLAYRRKKFALFQATEEYKQARETLKSEQSQQQAEMDRLMAEEEAAERRRQSPDGGASPPDADEVAKAMRRASDMSEEELTQFMFEFFTERYLSAERPEAPSR
jgi:hypothetical protein